MGNVLVVAEHLHGKFPKTTLVGVEAGKQMAGLVGGKCLGAVLGQGIGALGAELAGYGIDVAPRLKVLRLETPPKRTGGRKVGSVRELVQVLHSEAKVI